MNHTQWQANMHIGSAILLFSFRFLTVFQKYMQPIHIILKGNFTQIQCCTFFEHPIGQSVLKPKFDRTQCPWWCKNSRTSDLQKTKSVVVNRTGKVEVHITDNQSWNSCHKVASDNEFTFSSAVVPTKKNSIMHHDCALYMDTYFSQIENMMPLWSGRTGQQAFLLCWTQVWILLGSNNTFNRLVHSTRKTTEYESTELYSNWTKVPRGLGTINLWGF